MHLQSFVHGWRSAEGLQERYQNDKVTYRKQFLRRFLNAIRLLDYAQ